MPVGTRGARWRAAASTGPSGAALCRVLPDREWITRIGTGRAVRVTRPAPAP